MPAESKAQQAFMGIVLRYKRTGKMTRPKGWNDRRWRRQKIKIRKAAAGMTEEKVAEYAATKKKGLPKRAKKK